MKEKYMVLQEHKIIDKFCQFLVNGHSNWLLSFHRHLSNPYTINFMDDILIALELISFFFPLSIHSLNTTMLIF